MARRSCSFMLCFLVTLGCRSVGVAAIESEVTHLQTSPNEVQHARDLALQKEPSFRTEISILGEKVERTEGHTRDEMKGKIMKEEIPSRKTGKRQEAIRLFHIKPKTDTTDSDEHYEETTYLADSIKKLKVDKKGTKVQRQAQGSEGIIVQQEAQGSKYLTDQQEAQESKDTTVQQEAQGSQYLTVQQEAQGSKDITVQQEAQGSKYITVQQEAQGSKDTSIHKRDPREVADNDVPLDSSASKSWKYGNSLPDSLDQSVDMPSSEEYYDYYEDYQLPPVTEVPQAAPSYMVELYERFNSDRYSHPMANIVRSFQNMNEESMDLQSSHGNKSRVHTLMFNISSISRDEDIYLAEMRLYTLVEEDRNHYHGVDRKVSIYQETWTDSTAETPQRQLLDSKLIYGSHTGWETFTITTALKRWVRARTAVQQVEVLIESLYETDSAHDIGDMDIDTRPHRKNEPLLVVFSNDKKKDKSHSRELHELLAQEMRYLDDDSTDDDEYPDTGNYNNLYDDGELRLKRHATAPTNQTRKAYLERLYQQVLDIDNKGNPPLNATRIERQVRRKQRKRRKRNICRRMPMYVDFRDINWHRWIIAPKGYEAYECTGRCYFPLSDHLTPTKHAIIQTLLHTNYPQKGSRACCVPTRLEPISILYVDEQGVVTYKYRYEGMVVAQCGCR